MCIHYLLLFDYFYFYFYFYLSQEMKAIICLFLFLVGFLFSIVQSQVDVDPATIKVVNVIFKVREYVERFFSLFY